MKIEFAIKTDVNGKVGTGAPKNIVFEDVGNNMNDRPTWVESKAAGASLYKATFTNYKGEKLEDLPSVYINKEDIKRLAKAS